MTREIRPVTRITPIVAPRPGPGQPPLDPPTPPAPSTFDFIVSSLTVKNPRSLSSDSDFATLAINVLAADNTVVQQLGPVVRSLGGLGKGQTIEPDMSITGIAVPDGGSIAISFVVLNKGGWDWDSKVIDALELTGAAVLGALAQGQIAAPAVTMPATDTSPAVTTTTGPVPLAVVFAVGAAIVAVLEGLSIVLADCDGTVVPGVMTIGKTELLQFAGPGAWKIIYDYPGTDSPDGCGANSDYSVTYTVEPTPPPVPLVTVPNIVGKTIANGVKALNAVGLVGVQRTVRTASQPPGLIFAQTPPAGSTAPEHSDVTYDVPSPHVTPA